MKDPARDRWHTLFCGALNDTLTAAEKEELAQVLREQPATRQLWFLYQENECGLAELKPRVASPLPARTERPRWRPLAAAAAGLVLGLLGASLAWSFATPRAVATAAPVLELVDGSFEKLAGPVTRGFPVQPGLWGGDDAEVIASAEVAARDGSHLLRFRQAGADAAQPQGRAISCDVFQLVDLRPLRAGFGRNEDAVLELSAEFLDSRAQRSGSVTFFCQIFLFEGAPERVHAIWPGNIGDAIGSANAVHHSIGMQPSWRKLTARCFVPAHADFAVVQIAARPNDRPAPLDGLYADDVRMTLKRQPALPIRVVQR